MKAGALSDHFQGVGTKLLKGTEVDRTVSNGHELQGVDVFRAFLGTPSEKVAIPVTYAWINDEMEQPISMTLTGTWYDSRRGQLHRDPEYRLYYPAAAEEIVYRSRPGDRLFLCQPRSGPLLALFCPRGSTVEQQLLWLFGLETGESYFLDQVDLRESSGRPIGIAARHILELINIEVVIAEDQLLEKLLQKFGLVFPSTAKFSAFTRQLAAASDPVADPDHALLFWMDLEERLFMTLERHIVGERLKSGFLLDGQPNVDEFVRYSLGVQNRRKSRAGWAFGNHVEAILALNGLPYCREATTEKRNGPDFLFPSEAAYHSDTFPSSKLMMLGVKTTCKDRWRQVLAEANRIHMKHLLTLEPGISLAQTDEMRRAGLQLVLPSALHDTYQAQQRQEILSVADFLDLVKCNVKSV